MRNFARDDWKFDMKRRFLFVPREIKMSWIKMKQKVQEAVEILNELYDTEDENE